MNLHRRYLPLVFSLLLVAALDAQGIRTGTPESVGMSAERLGRIAPAMQALVEAGQIAGVETLVARRGVIVHHASVGFADREGKRPLTPETMHRIASMTKPVTSVAIMMLFEEGKLLLSDPVSRFIPVFRETKVLVPADKTTTNGDPSTLREPQARPEPSRGARASGSPRAESRGDDPGTVPARRAITIDDLLTHRSGIVYGFIDRSPVGELYRKNGVYDGLGSKAPETLAVNIDLIARQPLKFQPGSTWEYSLSIDVLGRVVEVASGMSLDEYFRKRIFEPLKMQDTHFTVPQAKMPRLSVLYASEKGVVTTPGPDQGSFATTKYYSGGAGLASTGRDYLRFAQMLLNGGELDGARILSRKTVALMMASHTQDLGPDAVGPGMGFGYGGSVRESLGRSNRPGSAGTFNWSGIFGTYFWVDPQEQLVTILMHNLSPRNNRAPELFQTLAYAAVVN